MSRSFSTDQHQMNQRTRPVMNVRRTRTLAEIEAASSSAVAPVAEVRGLTQSEYQSLSEFPELGGSGGSANQPNSVWNVPLTTSSFAVVKEYDESDEEEYERVKQSVYIPAPPPLSRRNAIALNFSNHRKTLPDPRWSRDRLPVCETNPGVWSKDLKPKVYKLSKKRQAWFNQHGYVPSGNMEDNERDEKNLQEFGEVLDEDDDEVQGPVGKTQWGDACTATEEDRRVRYKNSHEEVTPMGKFQFGTA